MNQNICKKRSKSKQINKSKKRSQKNKIKYSGSGEGDEENEINKCMKCKKSFDLDNFKVVLCKNNHNLCSNCLTFSLKNSAPKCFEPECFKCFDKLSLDICKCPLCKVTYYLGKSERTVVCKSNHSTCIQCLNSRINDDNFECPSCDNQIFEIHVIKFKKNKLNDLQKDEDELNVLLKRLNNSLANAVGQIHREFDDRLTVFNSNLKDVHKRIKFLDKYLENK